MQQSVQVRSVAYPEERTLMPTGGIALDDNLNKDDDF
jgi:hypothetical protein